MPKPRPIHLVGAAMVFVGVSLGFVVTMRSCAKALWQERFVSRLARTHLAWEDTHGSPR